MPAPAIVLISEGFGAGDGSKNYPIPVPSQIGITPGRASFTDGFPPLTRTALGAGGYPPDGEDMNGILYQITGHLALINSGQPYKYNAAQATAIGGYDVGAILLRADGTGFWFNQSAANSSDPDAGGAGWRPLNNVGITQVTLTSGTVTLTPAQASKNLIEFHGTLTGNVTVIFPANAGQEWVAASYATHSGYTITVECPAAGNLVTIPPGGYAQAQSVFSDGVNLYSNNISTAGLAPLNSPNLGGVPTAPNISNLSTSTNQIATANFVQQVVAVATAALAPLASPTFSGVPTAPTPALGDNTAKLATTSFVQAAVTQGASLAGNGYYKFSNGLILQWGRHGTTASGAQVVPFNIPFPSALYNVQTTNIALGGFGTSAPVINALGLSSFTINEGATGAGYDIFWFAIGK